MTVHLTQTAPTIVAPATAAGSALGIIRLSGSEAIIISEKIFQGKALSLQTSHTAHFGRILDPEASEIIDEVVATIFRGSQSFTGEDTVEISCHGSPYVMRRILEVCVAAGAVPAKEGEFTQRAFLNGKMDLTQAEAVADLIAAQSKAAQQSAMHQLRGGFSGDLRKMREELITFSALIELELDFSQEDVEFADRTQLNNLLDRINVSTSQLINSFRLGNAVKNGVSVAIVGKPNAGKSTLLNALLNEERAIVSDIAGTTRDTIEETMSINGILFRFIDTAGMRAHTTDTIEQLGIRRTMEKIGQAAVVIYLADIKEDNGPAVMDAVRSLVVDAAAKTVVVFNKADLISGSAEYIYWQEEKAQHSAQVPVLLLSAKEKDKGLDTIDDLKQTLYDLVATGIAPDQTIITNTRHLAALQQVQAAILEVNTGMENNISGELLALDIRRALDYIGELTGAVYHDKDVLGAIFGKFCIGK